MATVKTQHVREERWRETTRMMVLQQGEADWRLLKMDHMKIQDHIEKTEVQQP